MSNRDNFDHATTADEVLEGLDLTGRRVLITGGSSGLGAEAARAMAAKGADVIITARNEQKSREVVASIKADTGADVAVERLELGSFASIHAFAERFLGNYDKLDILINNAGVMACPQDKTEDGFELQFGTNHLGHFLMTNLIAPSLIKAASARVVSLSSGAHQRSPVLFDDINFETTPYDKWVAYGQAKTANVLFAVGLDTRLLQKGVRAFAVHPGVIHTPLSRHLPDEELEALAKTLENFPGAVKSVAAGAATEVYAATAPELDGKGGIYLADCNISAVDDAEVSTTALRSYAIDPENADRLWSVSEKMVGRSFTY